MWGWGYGGEGQLGLGSRIRTVFSPHPIPCIEPAAYGKDQSPAATEGNKSSEGQAYKVTGSCIKAIACGGRHSVVVTGNNCWPRFCLLLAKIDITVGFNLFSFFSCNT